MSTPPVTLDPRAAPERLREFLDAARARVDTDLEHRLAVPGVDPGRLRAAMHYAATGPGKRLRPALVLAPRRACGGDDSSALPAATAIELLHAYTLVHDDLPAMDDDDERRGRPTVHIAFGEAIAILAGDGLLTHGVRLPGRAGPRAGAAVATWRPGPAPPSCWPWQAIDLSLGERRDGRPRDDRGSARQARPARCSPPPPSWARSRPARPTRTRERWPATAWRSASRSSTPTIATTAS
jgi:hypothetical protein